MEQDIKSIAEQIECLARLTGAPESFVVQVRELFTRKGISLEEDSAPYLQALEEAFIREECIRAGMASPAPAPPRQTGEVGRIARAYGRQVERLRRVQAGLRRRRVVPGIGVPPAGEERETEVARGFGLVTRRESEILPMVPGPEEVQ